MPELGRRDLLMAAGIAEGASMLTVGGASGAAFARSSSLDGAASWHTSLVVYDGPAGYSDLSAISDDTLGVLCENGPRLSDEQPLTYYQRISLERVPLVALDRHIARPTTTPDASGHGNHAVVSGGPRRWTASSAVACTRPATTWSSRTTRRSTWPTGRSPSRCWTSRGDGR